MGSIRSVSRAFLRISDERTWPLAAKRTLTYTQTITVARARPATRPHRERRIHFPSGSPRDFRTSTVTDRTGAPPLTGERPRGVLEEPLEPRIVCHDRKCHHLGLQARNDAQHCARVQISAGELIVCARLTGRRSRRVASPKKSTTND